MDVVNITSDVKGYNSSDARMVSEAFRDIIPPENLPASTWSGVQSLALDSLVIEIDTMAITAV